MTDEELSREVALRRGWRRWRTAHPEVSWDSLPDYNAGWGWENPGDKKRMALLPSFATSLDACFGPGGPVEYIAMKGLLCSVGSSAPHHRAQGPWHAEIYNVSPDIIGEEWGDTPARALCLAFLAAVGAANAS